MTDEEIEAQMPEFIGFLASVLSMAPDAKPVSHAWNKACAKANPLSDTLSETDASLFSLAAANDPVAFDQLRTVVLDRLRRSAPLPVAFRLPAYLMLIQSDARLSRGRSKKQNSGRDSIIAGAVGIIWERFGIKPTRNESNKHDHGPASGCAIVSWLLKKNGILDLTEGAIEKIWNGSAFRIGYNAVGKK